MRADLKRLAKIAKSYVATCEPLNDVGVEFAEQLQEFGAGKDELGWPKSSFILFLLHHVIHCC